MICDDISEFSTQSGLCGAGVYPVHGLCEVCRDCQCGVTIRLAASQFEARDAQVTAAKAAEETARYTRSTARWMFWSVVAIAITSGIQALFAFLNWYAE
jgi:hypothetical protein